MYNFCYPDPRDVKAQNNKAAVLYIRRNDKEQKV